MKNKFALLLATLLTTATLSAHALSSATALGNAFAPVDENPAATEEATVVAAGVTQSAKIGTPCPCNTSAAAINQATEDARKANAYNQYVQGTGVSLTPGKTPDATQ
jgi:hypothetical protein